MFDPDQVWGGFLSSCIFMCWAKFCGRKCGRRFTYTLAGKTECAHRSWTVKRTRRGNCLPFQGREEAKPKPNTKQKQIPQSLTAHQGLCAFLLRDFFQTLTCSFIRLFFWASACVALCREHKRYSALCLEDAWSLVGKLNVMDRLSASVINAELEVDRKCLYSCKHGAAAAKLSQGHRAMRNLSRERWDSDGVSKDKGEGIQVKKGMFWKTTKKKASEYWLLSFGAHLRLSRRVNYKIGRNSSSWEVIANYMTAIVDAEKWAHWA